MNQGDVVGPYDPSREADVGHFIMAIKPDLFMPLDEFKSRMKYLYERVTGADKMYGVDRIYFPGELEILQHTVAAILRQQSGIADPKRRQERGIPWTQGEIDALNAEADLVGAPRLVL